MVAVLVVAQERKKSATKKLNMGFHLDIAVKVGVLPLI
jgi:hypothetical protein